MKPNPKQKTIVIEIKVPVALWKEVTSRAEALKVSANEFVCILLANAVGMVIEHKFGGSADANK